MIVDDIRMLHIQFSGDDRYVIGKGLELMFKLDNDSIITLYNMETSFAEYLHGKGDNRSYMLETNYLIPDDALEVLKKHKIIEARLYANDGYRGCKVSKRRAEKLQKMFNLI